MARTVMMRSALRVIAWRSGTEARGTGRPAYTSLHAEPSINARVFQVRRINAITKIIDDALRERNRLILQPQRRLLLRADRMMPSSTLVVGPLVSSKHRRSALERTAGAECTVVRVSLGAAGARARSGCRSVRGRRQRDRATRFARRRATLPGAARCSDLTSASSGNLFVLDRFAR